MEWFLSNQWRRHCDIHLQTWETQHCEVITYRHTVIRPGYCPFCLWNLDIPAEARLQYWLRSDNLREHIEGQHLNEEQWSTKKPMCGCLRTFDTERELRHHLHDAHMLNEAIWQSPKPPRKRKRACKVETQGHSTKPEEERHRKARFYRYLPPTQEREHQPSNNIFVPIPTVNPFIEVHPEKYSYSSISEKPLSSSRNSSACFSAAHSPLSSRPTTPGLEVIDPRILEPFDFNKGNGFQSNDEVATQLDSITPSLNGCNEKILSLNDNLHLNSPVLSVAGEQSGSHTSNKAEGNVEGEREECPVSVASSTELSAEEKDVGNIRFVKGKGDYREAGGDERPHVAGVFEATTGVNKRSRTPLNRKDYSNVRRPPQKLSAKDRRSLLALKSQNVTLRQIGPQFTHLDTAFLRQAWMDIKPSQRCTRSWTNRKRS